LILEALYALNEPKVKVRARKADYEVVRQAIEGAQGDFKKEMGHECKIEIDESDPLPEGS